MTEFKKYYEMEFKRCVKQKEELSKERKNLEGRVRREVKLKK